MAKRLLHEARGEDIEIGREIKGIKEIKGTKGAKGRGYGFFSETIIGYLWKRIGRCIDTYRQGMVGG